MSSHWGNWCLVRPDTWRQCSTSHVVFSVDSHLTLLKIAPPPFRLCPLTGVTGVWYDWIYEGNVAAPMLFVLLTAILLRWLKIAPPLSQPCPLTGVTGVWYDRIHDGSVAPPMLFVLLTAISLGLKLLHLLCFCPHYSNQCLVRPDIWGQCSSSHVVCSVDSHLTQMA